MPLGYVYLCVYMRGSGPHFIYSGTFHYSHKVRSKGQVLQRGCTSIVSEMKCNMWQSSFYIYIYIKVALWQTLSRADGDRQGNEALGDS